MAHEAKAILLQEEYEAATGIRPKYPRSKEALQELRVTLDRYNAAMANLKANDALRKGAKTFADEVPRLGQIDVVDDFDLDQPKSARKLS